MGELDIGPLTQTQLAFVFGISMGTLQRALRALRALRAAEAAASATTAVAA
jgi:hypothetical protein